MKLLKGQTWAELRSPNVCNVLPEVLTAAVVPYEKQAQDPVPKLKLQACQSKPETFSESNSQLPTLMQ